MSRRPSDMLRRECDMSESCDNACNYLVFGTEIGGLSTISRLQRNGIIKPITGLTTGANKTSNPGISNPSYMVYNANNALQNLIPLTIQYINAREASDFGDTSDTNNNVPELTETRTLTYYVPNGVLAATLGGYMNQRVGRWDYELSGQTAARVLSFIHEFASSVEFNSVERIWASRLSRTLNIPLVGSPVGRGPGILDHSEIFLRRIGSNPPGSLSLVSGSSSTSGSTHNNSVTIREIGLDLYKRVLSRGADIRSSVRNIQFEMTSTPGLFDVTIDNTFYPNSKIALKLNPLLKLEIAAASGLDIGPDVLRSEYRFVVPFPVSGIGFANTDFVNKLPWGCQDDSWRNPSSSSHHGCGCGSKGGNGWENRCRCDSSGHTGHTGFTAGIDFSQATPGPDLIYAYMGLSSDNPLGCNRSSNNVAQVAWNIQAYVTSDDLYSKVPGGRFSQPGYLLLIVDGQSLVNKRKISYDTDGNEINVIFNNNFVEYNTALEFATIVSNILYTVTGVKIPPKLLLRVNTTCIPSGECESGSLVSLTPEAQSSMTFWTGDIAVLYGSNSSASQSL